MKPQKEDQEYENLSKKSDCVTECLATKCQGEPVASNPSFFLIPSINLFVTCSRVVFSGVRYEFVFLYDSLAVLEHVFIQKSDSRASLTIINLYVVCFIYCYLHHPTVSLCCLSLCKTYFSSFSISWNFNPYFN